MILVEIDVLANHNYFKVYRQIKPGESERKLMLAVLVDAVQTYQKFVVSTSTRGKVLFRETETWFWSQDSDGLFSFLHICEVFGFDAALFRRALLKWRENRKTQGWSAKIVQLRSAANRRLKPAVSWQDKTSSSIFFEARQRDV